MGRPKKLKVSKLDDVSTAVSPVVSSPVTRASKLRAGKDLPESSNPSGGDAKMKKISIEESDSDEELVGVGKKIDFLVQSVQEFSSKGIKLLNDGKAMELTNQSQYLASQKMVSDLTKQNQELSLKLASALAKLEAYEQMNALGQMKEMTYASNMAKATETFINFTSQLTSGQGTTSGVISLPAKAPAAEPNAPAADPKDPVPQEVSGQGTTSGVISLPAKAPAADPVPQELSGQGTIAAEQTTGQGTTSTVNVGPTSGRSKRTVTKKVR